MRFMILNRIIIKIHHLPLQPGWTTNLQEGCLEKSLGLRVEKNNLLVGKIHVLDLRALIRCASD
jgi:hypothetical protein